MMRIDKNTTDIRTLSGLVLTLGIALGVVLLFSSYFVHEKGYSAFFSDFLKYLGIVLAAVCGVHLVYEALLAEKYFDKFASQLRKEVEQGETNVATCAALGIEQIFPSRDLFKQAHSIQQWLLPLQVGGNLRIVARSLFV